MLYIYILYKYILYFYLFLIVLSIFVSISMFVFVKIPEEHRSLLQPGRHAGQKEAKARSILQGRSKARRAGIRLKFFYIFYI